MFHCTIFQTFISNWASSCFLLFFSFFAGPEEAEGDGWAKKVCNPSGVRGTSGTDVDSGGYPCELVSGSCVCRGLRGQWINSSLSPGPLPWYEGLISSLSLPQREPISPQPPQCQWLQRGGGNIAWCTSSFRPLWGHADPSGSTTLKQCCRGDLWSPTASLN